MKKIILVALVALIVGVGSGYGIAQINPNSPETGKEATGHDTAEHHGHNDAAHAAGGHGMYEVTSENAPTVSLSVTEDAKSGWNIKVDTTNFKFAPQNVNADNVTGEGHAHLYVDGEKIGRLYGPHFHYDKSFDGERTFSVTLNANDHSEYALDGQAITAEAVVTHAAHE